MLPQPTGHILFSEEAVWATFRQDNQSKKMKDLIWHGNSYKLRDATGFKALSINSVFAVLLSANAFTHSDACNEHYPPFSTSNSLQYTLSVFWFSRSLCISVPYEEYFSPCMIFLPL